MLIRLRSIITAIVEFLHRHRKPLSLVAVFLSLVLCVGILLNPNSALAQAGTINDPGFFVGLFTRILLAISRLFLAVTVFILTFIIEVAGYNGYLNATTVNVGWVMVRDLSNMFFVVILLLIAFGTILGVESYEWKKLLIKFIMAAVLVNFSRVICGVFIDLAQVIMVTFVNGIAATAGGNLINAFRLESLRDINPSADQFKDTDYFLAAIGAVFFSSIVMAVMAVFLVMLLARMIALWVLIVLSPLAFVLSVIPQTQSYANNWWSEFGSNVTTGPVLLFFVWLSFVTVGSGNISEEIARNSDVPNRITAENSAALEANRIAGDQSAGIGKAMQWNNMANFAIAIGMLMVGAKVASQIGGIGGSWAQGAVDFGKKVATYATGIQAARYVGGKAADLGKKGAKYAGLALPAAAYYGLSLDTRLEQLKEFGKSKLGAYRIKRLSAVTPQARRTKKYVAKDKDGNEAKDRDGNKIETTDEQEMKRLRALGYKMEERWEPVTKKVPVMETERDAATKRRKLKDGREVDDDGRVWAGGVQTAERLEFDKEGRELDNNGKPKAGGAELKQNAVFKKDKDGRNTTEMEYQEEIEMESAEEMKARSGLFWRMGGKRQAALFASRKKAKKTDDYLKNMEELVMLQTRGIPAPLGFKNDFFDGEDRFRQGQIKAEKARSAAKTEQYSALGEQSSLVNSRFQNGKYEHDKGALGERIAYHKLQGEATQAQIKSLMAEAQTKNLQGNKGKQVLQAKISADLRVKAAESEKKALEAKEQATMATKQLAGMDSIRRAVEADRQAHTEGEKMKELQKRKEKEYLQTHHGREELREEAELKAKLKTTEGEIKGLEAGTEKVFASSDSGKALIRKLADTEIEVKTAEDQTKDIKNSYIKEQFFKASKVTETFQKPEDYQAYLDNKANPVDMKRYLESAKLTAQQANSEKLSALFKSNVESDANTMVVDMKARGYGGPKTGHQKMIKAETEDISLAGDEGRGDNLIANTAFSARQRRLGAFNIKNADGSNKSVDELIKAEELKIKAVASLVGVARGSNVDDAILASAVKRFDVLDITDVAERRKLMTEEEEEGLKAMREDWETMGIASKGHDGKWTTKNSGDTNALLAYYTASGSDMDLVKTHQAILAVAGEEKNADGTEMSYEQAQAHYFSTGKKIGNYDSDTYNKFFKDNQSSFVTMQDEMQRAGVSSGHFQQAGFFRRGINGQMRFTTHAEQIEFERQQKKKNENVKSTPQSVATIDGRSGFKDVDSDRFGTSNVVQAITVPQLNQRAQDRTKDMLSLDSKKVGKIIMLGGDVKHLTQIGEGDADLGRIRTMENYLKIYREQRLTVALANSSRHGTDQNAAARGKLDASIEGLEAEIKGDDVDKIAESMRKYLEQRIKEAKTQAELARRGSAANPTNLNFARVAALAEEKFRRLENALNIAKNEAQKEKTPLGPTTQGNAEDEGEEGKS